jgi:hypothetical protein
MARTLSSRVDALESGQREIIELLKSLKAEPPATSKVSEPRVAYVSTKAKLNCVGHARKRLPTKACRRNFSAQEFLDQHNAWAHAS